MVMERVRQALSKIVWGRHPDATVTVSIGLAGASGPIGEITPEQWVEAADRNLYAAKRGGRNRCIMTDLSPAPADQSVNKVA